MIDSFSGEYRFLSNFFVFPISWQGFRWPSIEHAYQAAKTYDNDTHIQILNAGSPGKAKRIGRTVKLRSDWEDVKLGIMLELVVLKFVGTELQSRLVNTRPHELVEGNTWNDTYWGVCRGIGENHLGKILMDVRDNMC